MQLIESSKMIGVMEDPYENPTVYEEQQIGDSFAASEMHPSENAYDGIQEEYIALGNSPTVESVRAAEGNREAQTRNDVVHELAVNPTSTPESIEYAARAAVDLDQSPVDLLMSVAARAAALDLSMDINEQQREDDRADPIYSRVDQLRAKALLLQREVRTAGEEVDDAALWDSPFGAAAGAIVDAIGVVLPLNEAKAVYFAAEAVGLDPTPADAILYGNLKKKVIRKMKAASGPEREVLAAKLKIALQEHSGFLGDNHFLRKFLIDEFTVTMDDEAWYHVIDNVVGVLDVTGVTKFGAMTAKAVGKSVLGTTKNANTAVRGKLSVPKGSPLDVMKTANPEVASKAAKEAILDETGNKARKLGTTREAILEEYGMPNVAPKGSKITVTEGMPAKVVADLIPIYAKLAAALRRATPDITNILKQEEIAGAKAKVLTKFERYFKTEANTADSILKVGEDNMTLTAQFQADEYGGWKSLQDLFDDVTAKKGAQTVEDVRVWHRANDSDDYIDVTDDLEDIYNRWTAGDTGDFTYSVDFDIPISPEWKHALPDNAVAAGMGRMGKHFQGAQMFNKDIREGFFVAVDKVGQLNKELGNVVKEAFSNVGGKGINLYRKNKDYEAVIQTLQEGAMAERWYTPSELLARGFTEDQMTAYYGYKAVNDTIWQATSHDLWKTLNEEGMSTLSFNGKYQGIFGRGMPVEEAQSLGAEVTHAYNPMTGKAIDIQNPEHVARMYREGKRVAKARSNFSEDGQNFYNYLVIDEGRGARIEKLTRFPTPYHDGHYFRAYKDDNFIVRRKIKDGTVDGLPAKELKGTAVGVAKTGPQARQLVKSEVNQYGGVIDDYEIVPGQKWHEGRLQSGADDDWDMIQRSALASNRGRGQHLRGVEDKAAQIENPIDALGRSISAVSSRIGKRDVLEANMEQWSKTYGARFETQGFWSGGRKELIDHINKKVSETNGSQRYAKEAIAYYDYIQMNRGVGAPTSEIWKNWVFKQMRDSDTELFQSIAPTMAHIAGWINPALRLKQSAFLFYLAWNPLKQLILQPSQIINMISVHPQYMASKFVPELTALTAEAIGGKGGKLGKQVLKELDASGLTKNIDHHQWINQSQSARLLGGDAIRPFSLRNTAQRLSKVPQKVGFEAGEKANQVMHWLVARNEYSIAHPGADLLAKKHSDNILGRARELSGSMNAAGKFGYQGWGTFGGEMMSTVMQFMSHSHKMLQMIVPQKIGGARFLTPAQKTRLAFGNTMLAGAGLWPAVTGMLNYVQEQNPELEMSPDLQRAVTRGLIDHSLNKMIGITIGEDINLDFAATYTPTGNIPMFTKNLYESITNDPLRQWDFVAGVGAGSTILDTISSMNAIWSTSEERYPTDDKFEKSFVTATDIASGVSNYRKAKMILEKGKTVSKYGTVQAEALYTESIFKLFGLKTDGESAYGDLIELTKSQRAAHQSIKDDVRQLNRNFNRLWTHSNADNLVKFKELNYMIAEYFPDMNERRIAQEEMSKLMQDDIATGVESIGTKALTQAFNAADFDALRTFVRNHPDANEEINVFIEALTTPKSGEQ